MWPIYARPSGRWYGSRCSGGTAGGVRSVVIHSRLNVITFHMSGSVTSDYRIASQFVGTATGLFIGDQ